MDVNKTHLNSNEFYKREGHLLHSPDIVTVPNNFSRCIYPVGRMLAFYFRNLSLLFLPRK